jgi:hypothetical protein
VSGDRNRPPVAAALCAATLQATPLLPGLDQRLGLSLVGVHDQIPALARFTHIVGAQRKTDPLGRPTPAFQAQMTPPSAVVIPNVMVRPVFPVRQFDKFVLHNEKFQSDPSRATRQPHMTLKNHPRSVAVPGAGRSSPFVEVVCDRRTPSLAFQIQVSAFSFPFSPYDSLQPRLVAAFPSDSPNTPCRGWAHSSPTEVLHPIFSHFADSDGGYIRA